MLNNEPAAVDTSMTLMMGEMRGQLRELIHGFNNLSQIVTGLASSVDKSSHMPGEIAELKVRLTAFELRLSALEAERHQRDGAIGVGQWLLKSPVIGWLVAGGLAVGAWFARKEGV